MRYLPSNSKHRFRWAPAIVQSSNFAMKQNSSSSCAHLVKLDRTTLRQVVDLLTRVAAHGRAGHAMLCTIPQKHRSCS
eukprot:1160857-Pelagomonas_calceolata.AAC.7